MTADSRGLKMLVYSSETGDSLNRARERGMKTARNSGLVKRSCLG